MAAGPAGPDATVDRRRGRRAVGAGRHDRRLPRRTQPVPDDSRVEVRRLDAEGWEPATVLERTESDEWLIEYDTGGAAWRDQP